MSDPGPNSEKSKKQDGLAADQTHAGEVVKSEPSEASHTIRTEELGAQDGSGREEPNKHGATAVEPEVQNQQASEVRDWAKIFSDFFVALFKYASRSALALVLLAVIFIGYFGPDKIMNYFDGSSLFASPSSDLPNVSPASEQEWRLASADHQIIASAVAACSKIFDLNSLPDYIRSQLRLDTLPNGQRRTRSILRSEATKPELIPSNFQRTAIYLSDAIARARSEAATNASANYLRMFWFQLAIVGIGALTTILISIKSISSSNSNWYFWIGIFAIIFSSIGTGTSALNSFYGPRESYFRSERSLASLRQLHSDIAVRITSTVDAEHPEKCPKLKPDDKDDLFGKQVQDWTNKFGSILNATDSGSSSPSTGNPAAASAQPSKAGGSGVEVKQ